MISQELCDFARIPHINWTHWSAGRFHRTSFRIDLRTEIDHGATYSYASLPQTIRPSASRPNDAAVQDCYGQQMTRSSHEPDARSGSKDRNISIALLIAQIPFPLIGIVFAKLSTLDDSHCSFRPGDGYADCGDPDWPDRAETLSMIGGALLFVATLAWIAWAVHRRSHSSAVSVCFFAAQIVLLLVSGGTALQFGPQ